MTTPTALAPAPSRATTTITLSLGLMTIPLSVYTGVEETRVARSEFVKVGDALVAVGRSPIRKDTGATVETADVVRMAQADNGAWVTLTDDEIAACTTERGLATVQSFIPASKASQYLTVDVKQVRPKREKGKANPAYEKAFALLLAGLKARKVLALVNVAMRGPARYALLDKDANLFLIASADQIRQAIPLDNVTVTTDEVAMMGNLIDAIGVSTPTLTDETAPKVRTFVNNKAVGIAPAAPVVAAAPATDIMSQLAASVAAANAKKEAAA